MIFELDRPWKDENDFIKHRNKAKAVPQTDQTDEKSQSYRDIMEPFRDLKYPQYHASQSVVQRPEETASPGGLLGMQNLKPSDLGSAF